MSQTGRDGRDVVTVLKEAGLLRGPAGVLPQLGGITTDSRTVRPGDLFVATRGSEADGHRFVPQAAAAGAVAAVVEHEVEADLAQLVVDDGQEAARVLAAYWYGHPADRLGLIGVTGTNGKTTTTALVRHLLNRNGDVASIGTLGAFDGEGRPLDSTAGVLTTPGPIDLQATLAGALEAGATRVVLEASSHSLDQGRLDGLSFEAAVFTNLSRDHLDYHPSMEAYRDAKLRLVGALAPDGVAVVNADEDAWAGLQAPRVVRFGMAAGADLRIGAVRSDATGSRFEIGGRYGAATASLPLLGGFNVENAAAALATAVALGMDLADAADRLSTAPQVPGRMERLALHPCPVLRDYAHTPDALERALLALRPLTTGRIIAVVGCGGDRDAGKRPMMGRIVEQLADVPVITSDNPRTEDPEAILDDMQQGMQRPPAIREADRRAAIAAVLAEARSEDTILLAGKGHETYQVIGTERLPFDEAIIVRELTGE